MCRLELPPVRAMSADRATLAGVYVVHVAAVAPMPMVVAALAHGAVGVVFAALFVHDASVNTAMADIYRDRSL